MRLALPIKAIIFKHLHLKYLHTIPFGIKIFFDWKFPKGQEMEFTYFKLKIMT